jgi:hypothetical protein
MGGPGGVGRARVGGGHRSAFGAAADSTGPP